MEKSIISIAYRDFNPDLTPVQQFQKPILSFVQNQFRDYYVVSTSFFYDFRISTIFQPFSPYSPIGNNSTYFKFENQYLTSFFNVSSKKDKSYFIRLFRFSARFSRLYTIYTVNRIINSLVTNDGVKRIDNYMFKFPQLTFCINQFQIIKTSIFNKFKLFKFNVRNTTQFRVFDSNVIKIFYQNFIRNGKGKWPFFSIFERMLFKFFNTWRTKKTGGIAIIAKMGILKVGYIFHHQFWKYISFTLSKMLRRKLSKKNLSMHKFWRQYYKILCNEFFYKQKTLGFIGRELARRANIWWHEPRYINWFEAVFKASDELKRQQNLLLQFFHPIPKNEIYLKIINAYLHISSFNKFFTEYSIYFYKLRDHHDITKIYKIFNKLKPLFQYSREQNIQQLKFIFFRITNSTVLNSNYQFFRTIFTKLSYPIAKTQIIDIFKRLNRFFILYYFGIQFRIPKSDSKFSFVTCKSVINQKNNKKIIIFQNNNQVKEFDNTPFISAYYTFSNNRFKFQVIQQPAIYFTIKKNFYFGGETPWDYYILLSSSSVSSLWKSSLWKVLIKKENIYLLKKRKIFSFFLGVYITCFQIKSINYNHLKKNAPTRYNNFF